MDEMEIFKQDVCRCALECNANLVVVYNGKKTFWYYEQLQALVDLSPGESFTLMEFCELTDQVGDKCTQANTKNTISLVARNVAREEALSEY